MSFHVDEIKSQRQLDEIVDVIWAANEGVDPTHQIFFPILGSGPWGRHTAIAESKRRLWEGHKVDPASHWIYVISHETGQIVGGGQWRIYEENPIPNPTPPMVASWWPGGVGQDFASEVVRQCYAPRVELMAKPHTSLSLMCILPILQHERLGGLLMKWGLQKTDQLGLESFVEATGYGQELCRKYGYGAVKSVQIHMEHVEGKVEEWKELERKTLPIRYDIMWRSAKGL